MATQRGDVFWCDLCGTWRGNQTSDCKQVACLACGTIQCFSNGTARGCCRSCYYGRLPGWSHRVATCEYKGCNAVAVYSYLPGNHHNACKTHGGLVLDRQRQQRDARQAKRQRVYR